jgi:threonine/homoserine/homoserine lactone efflux protein
LPIVLGRDRVGVAPARPRIDALDVDVHLIPFVLVATALIAVPGVDMTLVMRNALKGGARAAVATALGVNAGVTLWVLAAALGVAALVAASGLVFDIIKLAGAAYLAVLGVRAILASCQAHASEGGGGTATALTPRAAFRQGLASNLLNPKMALLFTGVLPQFLDRGADQLGGTLVLGAIFNALGLIWLVAFAVLVARGRNVLTRPAVRRVQERLAGCVLIALGVRVAVQRQ